VLGTLVGASLTGLVVTWLWAKPAAHAAEGDASPPASKLPPLKVNRAKPLLLDGGSSSAKGGLPPLKVDRAKPLRLGESPSPGASSAAKTKKKVSLDGLPVPKADNQACFVCHNNYQEEELASVHADNNVGCIKCHGESLEHRNDENNVTPPQRMYPSARIDSACKECHSEHNAAATKVLEKWMARCPHKKEPAAILCTDCHGEHRLKNRTVRWDKATGKLLGAEKTAAGAASK
jgi:hypothetical protein